VCVIAYTASQDNTVPDGVRYESIPLRFDNPAIFDSQPKIPNSVPFKDLFRDQVSEIVEILVSAFDEGSMNSGYDLIHVQHGMYIGSMRPR